MRVLLFNQAYEKVASVSLPDDWPDIVQYKGKSYVWVDRDESYVEADILVIPD